MSSIGLNDPSSRSKPQISRRISVGSSLLFILGFIAIVAGIAGALRYEQWIEPNVELFICCVPGIVVGLILIFFSLLFRLAFVRGTSQGNYNINRTAFYNGNPNLNTKSGKDSANEGWRSSKVLDRLTSEQRKVMSFLENIEEQHRSGLLMDETYVKLKSKYENELSSISSEMESLKGPDGTVK